VGATTVAVHLAATLAQDALRVVLIDADLYRADVAAQCNVVGGFGIGDVLVGRKTIHEVLQRGPAGMQILTGTASTETRRGLGERAIQRLLRQMRSLSPHADWLLVDAGNQPSEFTARLWSVADSLLLVTSPDAVAVMDTYALIKTLLSQRLTRPSLSLVVNQADDEATAADVHRRIDQSCQRFLGLSVDLAGGIPRALTTLPPHGDAAPAFPHEMTLLAPAFARLAKQILASCGPSTPSRMAA
jgi:flagellar biosynthesis protein FlhG